MFLPLAQLVPGISDAAFWSIVAALVIGGLLLLCLIALVVFLMLRTSRLSKALAATADAELRTKLLQQSHWWPRFRFRTMLVGVTLAAICLGMFVAEWNRAKRQSQIVSNLNKGSGEVLAHYQLGVFGDSMIAKLLCHWVHPDFGCTLTDLATMSYGWSTDNGGLTEDDLRQLAKLKSLNSLAIGGDLTEEGIELLTRLPNLKRFALVNCRISNETIRAIAKMKKLELLELRYLDLSNVDLQQLGELENLHFLHLYGNSLPGNQAKILAESDAFKSIEIEIMSESDLAKPGNSVFDNDLFGRNDDWSNCWRFKDNRPYLPTYYSGVPGPPQFQGGGGAF